MEDSTVLILGLFAAATIIVVSIVVGAVAVELAGMYKQYKMGIY